VLDLALAVLNVSAEICDATAHTRIGWLRSVYNIFQGLSIGSFVDEIAEAKKADPRDVWLELIGPRAGCLCLTWESRSCPTMDSRLTSIPWMPAVCEM
jgi:hypothetical protein